MVLAPGHFIKNLGYLGQSVGFFCLFWVIVIYNNGAIQITRTKTVVFFLPKCNNILI